MKYALIKENAHLWPIETQCRVYGVSSTGYRSWRDRKPSKRALENQKLDKRIQGIYDDHKGRYGVPRITDELNDQGLKVNKKRVENRMKVLNLKGKQARKFKVTTDSNHQSPVADNLLNQDFTATDINQKWAGDITYVWTQSGWLYLAVIIDLFSRQVIGWSLSNRINKELVCNALQMALWRRGFPKGVIVHTDRGSQYCSKKYQKLLKDNQLICSMSGKGCCYDNAVSETFFHTLKVECLFDYCFTTREDAKQTIFEYIEVYYNRKRKHSTIGYKTPAQYELLYRKAS